MINHAAQSGRHPFSARGDDCYSTPACAVEELLRVERLPQIIWEPAAGRGAIVAVLRNAGYTVITSDIVAYDFALDFVADFLVQTKARAGIEAVVTNPPFKIATKFVTHALELVPTVVMLCRLAFLESTKRTLILDAGTLARVHVFKRRLPMMHRDGWQGPRASSAIPFAWFVWSRDHKSATIIDRI